MSDEQTTAPADDTKADPPVVPQSDTAARQELPDVLEFEVAGKIWRCGKVSVFAVKRAAEEKVREQRREEFKHVIACIAAFPDDAKREATVLAFDNLLRNVCVPQREADQWLGSPTGNEFMAWHSLKGLDPTITIEQARDFHDSLNIPQLSQLSDFLQLKMLTS